MTIEVKDFQRATARRILHLFKDLGRRRVLLADEVGLGKTFVARQVIDLVREWHRTELHDDFFRVVYICSNANIADQNIAKLGVSNNLAHLSISESRLSMQHLHITRDNHEIAARAGTEMPESIIPLTPSTSFRFYSALGTANERALIFVIIKEMEELHTDVACVSRYLSCGVKNWERLCRDYQNQIHQFCGEDYIPMMIDRLRRAVRGEVFSLLLDEARSGGNYQRKAEIVNRLRRAFAEISVDMLDPDLVIMDEFQRFSDLLDQDDNEQSMLARRFFDARRTNTKVLLLSATPYKPYSTLEELNMEGHDAHYQDFMKVMDFLFVTRDRAESFKTVWQHYSTALKQTSVTDLASLLEAKSQAENALYGVMSRTERFNDGIIDDANVTDIEVQPGDILSYAQGQGLLDRMGAALRQPHGEHLPPEYVKSSPYLLSFMDRYELKRKFVSGLAKIKMPLNQEADTLLLSKYYINNYRPIDPANGRLRFLHDLLFGSRREKKTHLLLWVPTSHPYYSAGGLFESEEAQHFSKVLLFSAWEMVPRMVSVMLSYYTELYTIGEVKKQRPDIRYTTSRYGENRLRAEGLLEYPCRALSLLYTPAEYYGQSLTAVRRAVAKKVQALLEGNERIRQWPRRRRGNVHCLCVVMKLLDGVAVEEEQDLYLPDNAVDVLTDVAIASPAVCALRQADDSENAKEVAKGIVSIFNKPEAAAVIDLIYARKNDEDYYESVLDYCAKGNLQAVLDEYAHMLGSAAIGKNVREAIIGTSTLYVDTKNSVDRAEKPLPMRCHFALPFIDKTVTDQSVLRTANMLKAFNSPFRPFVLSTTSIGQEGLDFHVYARKVVHWNLPANPVDLEQREGRVNRYKCLAIRRNVARLFRSQEYRSWDDLFAAARQALKGDYSDMVPYWCLPTEKLTEEQRSRLEYIERIVPLYPFSRDGYKYERLIHVLSLYRMTLGQPRQEELLSLLKNMQLKPEQMKQLTMDLCPFHKKDE